MRRTRDMLAAITALQDRATNAGYELSVTAEGDGSWTYALWRKRFPGLPAKVGGGSSLETCLAAIEMTLAALPRR